MTSRYGHVWHINDSFVIGQTSVYTSRKRPVNVFMFSLFLNLKTALPVILVHDIHVTRLQWQSWRVSRHYQNGAMEVFVGPAPLRAIFGYEWVYERICQHPDGTSLDKNRDKAFLYLSSNQPYCPCLNKTPMLGNHVIEGVFFFRLRLVSKYALSFTCHGSAIAVLWEKCNGTMSVNWALESSVAFSRFVNYASSAIGSPCPRYQGNVAARNGRDEQRKRLC